MSEREIKELLARLDEAKRACEQANRDRVAAEILTHVDPPVVAGPQFQGGPYDGESCIEKMGWAYALHEWEVRFPVYRPTRFVLTEPDAMPEWPQEARYRRGRTGDWHYYA